MLIEVGQISVGFLLCPVALGVCVHMFTKYIFVIYSCLRWCISLAMRCGRMWRFGFCKRIFWSNVQLGFGSMLWIGTQHARLSRTIWNKRFEHEIQNNCEIIHWVYRNTFGFNQTFKISIDIKPINLKKLFLESTQHIRLLTNTTQNEKSSKS